MLLLQLGAGADLSRRRRGGSWPLGRRRRRRLRWPFRVGGATLVARAASRCGFVVAGGGFLQGLHECRQDTDGQYDHGGRSAGVEGGPGRSGRASIRTRATLAGTWSRPLSFFSTRWYLDLIATLRRSFCSRTRAGDASPHGGRPHTFSLCALRAPWRLDQTRTLLLPLQGDGRRRPSGVGRCHGRGAAATVVHGSLQRCLSEAAGRQPSVDRRRSRFSAVDGRRSAGGRLVN